jgi:hypothetical protein
MRYSDMATLIREAEGATSEAMRLAKLADVLLNVALVEEDSGSRPRLTQATTGQRVHFCRMTTCTATAGKPRTHGPTVSSR